MVKAMQRFHLSSGNSRILLSSLILILSLLNFAPLNAQSDGAGEVFNAAIAAPSHLEPSSGSTSTALTDPPVGVPTLRWSAVGEATRYNIQISVSEGFATTIVNQNTSATSFTPKEVLADGIYFWRVRAQVGSAWGNFSEAWSFQKDWSAAGEVKPLLTAPANDPDGLQVITSFSPEHFSWEPVTGAAAYILEISVSPSFNDSALYRVTTLKTHHTPLAQLANNQYYWRVIPLDARDNAGEASEVRTFTFGWNQIPELLTPEDDHNARFLPRFTWNAVPGASSYVLEVSSQENFSALELNISTRNTSYTPEKALANNKDYFWRVRAVSPQKVNGPPSAVRGFRANWVEPPTLLSPPVRSIYHIYPYFSWTPVAGAERYQLQIATGNGFDKLVEDITLVNATAYSQPSWDEINWDSDYFWRVRAEDAQGNTTNWSDEQSFQFAPAPPPNLIYPEPYYVPDAVGLPVHSDRTIAYPIFVWDTTHQWTGANNGKGHTSFLYPDYYRLEVATTLDFNNNVVFSIDSAGQAAAPTVENSFSSLVDGTIYYWRVTPIVDGEKMAEGTIWETRIDRTIPQLPLDSDSVPDISHPQDGSISVASAPILGWLPVAGADRYEVQISDSSTFATIVDSANALFPYYVPWQGRQTAMPSGAYWWRVRAKNGDSALGDWSSARYFFVMDNLMTGNEHDYVVPTNGTLRDVGDPLMYDPALSLVATDTFTAAAPYNVGPLHVVQDRSLSATNRDWVIAFGADNDDAASLTYALYFDVNQKPGVGGTSDPRNKPITFDPLYLPDYVIYLERANGMIVDGQFYEWTGSKWQGPFSLAGLGGTFFFDALGDSVQVIFPYTTIIRESTDNFSGGVALTVYSTGSAANAAPVDSVPQQGATLNRPALFSNMPVPLYPFDTPLSNPIVFHELPTLRWRMPGFNSTDGYIVQVARNPNFTEDTIVETWETYESNTSSYYGAAPTAFRSGKAYNDDESYYWRVRYRHERFDRASEYDVSPWSQPVRFKLASYQPGNPTITPGNWKAGEPAYATPSFTWDRVEGAARYSIQIDDDFNMNSPILNKTIDGNSYTSVDTLPDGTYYWRVAMRRSDQVLGQWTSIISFTKSSLVPSLISPVNGVVVNDQPTFVWAATITNTGELRISAPRYRLQWDDNPQFNSPTTIETEATSYTPVKGKSLDDSTWFWRVAIIDGNGKRGPDSPAATFYKEYLWPETLSPVQGSSEGESITFAWEPLAGAASYKIEIDDNEAFDSPIRVTTDNTRYTHTDSFKPGEYYWRVQMIDRDGKPGPTIPGRFSQGPDTPGNPDAPAVFIPFVLAP
jgi:hypothetical protein